MTQLSLFGSGETEPSSKPHHDRPVRLRLLVTVKAATRPSRTYGQTACVAGLRTDVLRPSWIRLYPINFHHLDQAATFRKYDVISLDARPARPDPRPESYRPIIDSIVREQHLTSWQARRRLLDPCVEYSMCRLYRNARQRTDAQSLALVRPRQIRSLLVSRHPGWTAEEQRTIDAYTRQPALFGDHPRPPLPAPRFRVRYHYTCHEPGCRGHRQEIDDGELVAFQQRLSGWSDAALRSALRTRFLDEMCAPDRSVAFYVGNQVKRVHTFSVLGVYWPRRQPTAWSAPG